MYNAQHHPLGLYGHAMILSLPPVLLVWAIVAFTVSLIGYTMQNISTTDSLSRALAWVVFSVFLVLCLLVMLALYTLATIWSFHPRRKNTRLPRLWA